ncbi:PREDICTED: laminin subunit gamma-1-like, partial [Hipposideros armiger]|uniref:Laminin subunit gamma-1-like n=1 Tax=Hipposideros armiger TaxID=186990 RepID=A0A8B7QTC8_HIPAR
RARGRLWPALAVLAAAAGCVRAAMDECADEGGRAQRCMPEFVNAAFNVTVVATNTCGTPPEEYCVQTGVTGVTKSCHLCDAGQPHLQHGAAFLTDYNNQADTTWWQSQTMLAGVQYPNAINLTLHLAPAPAAAPPPPPTFCRCHQTLYLVLASSALALCQLSGPKCHHMCP